MHWDFLQSMVIFQETQELVKLGIDFLLLSVYSAHGNKPLWRSIVCALGLSASNGYIPDNSRIGKTGY